uniref:Reverse transcriptase domain-containing protein n=1 Tax=Tanacetum cinerariifolium TaxID=118510 RepID=A0A6L2LA15_TANCI|nr:reverse transcriptase domain-containing protein [Tanacetum cinerariifolium]
MAGPEPITPLNEGTSSQNAKSLIEGHDVSDEEIEGGMKGKAKIGDEDLGKPFKEVLKCPFTRRIIEFSSPGHRLPANTRIYDGTGDPEDHVGRFVGMGNQGEWPMPEKFLNRFGMLKACDKDPTEISKIVRKANETLPHFKERWVSESNVIPNVPELMQISTFMSSHKCPELAKRFSDNIPKTVDEILKRVDEYLRSEEAFCSTELPRGNLNEGIHQCNGQNETTETSGSTMGITVVGKSTRNLSNGTPVAPAPTSTVDGSTQETTMTDEEWMNVPIIFPPVLARYLPEEALVVEAEVEGYLVWRIHIDEGASVEIMFEHCFNMLHPSIRSKLVETQTIVFGFSGEQVKPLGNIKLDVCFRGGGRCRRAIMKFTVIPAPSPYNIIMGRPGLKQLRAIPSTIHGMIKFPTPWGGNSTIASAGGVRIQKRAKEASDGTIGE